MKTNKAPDLVLLDCTKEFLSNSSYSQAQFTHELLLPRLIEVGIEKQEDHKTADEYEAWRSAKVRQMNGILNGHTNVPLRWIWAWIEVLPEPYGTKTKNEFLSSGGVMNIALGRLSDSNDRKANLPDLMREVADCMEKGVVVAADGMYDEKDDPKQLVELADEFSDVVQLCLGEILKISNVVDLSNNRSGTIVKMCK